MRLDIDPGRIHIFNGFQNPHGGSELEALALQALLSRRAPVRMWATSSRADPHLLQVHGIRRVKALQRVQPDGGTYIFVGAHWRNKLWPYLISRPARLIYIYNTFHPKAIALTSHMPRLLAWPAVEYVVISVFQARLSGLAQEVQIQPSPIDIQRFVPCGHAPVVVPAVTAPPHPRLTIGRMSRDTPDKHDPSDFALYADLAAKGHVLRLQGATCIADALTTSIPGFAPMIKITSAGHEAAETFLQNLDIFYYRSGAHVETFGRVVFEAMACGLPVVCHAYGGYADWIRHGENGFLFETTEQASAILSMLIADATLRERVGAAARRTVEQMYASDAIAQRMAFFLASGPAGSM